MDYKDYIEVLYRERKLRLDRDVNEHWVVIGEKIIDELNKNMKFGVGYSSCWRYSFLTIDLL